VGCERRQFPVRVYELVDVTGGTPPAHLARFAEGLALYFASLVERLGVGTLGLGNLDEPRPVQ
jgi:hypothetical protein